LPSDLLATSAERQTVSGGLIITMTAAARQRRWRARQRKGAAVLHVEIPDYCGLVGQLLDIGGLAECESEDRRQIEIAYRQPSVS
jgi:hypothetical protein